MDQLLKNIGTSANGGTGGIQSLVQSLSITGNIMLDTMILMNAYGFFKSYLEIAANMIKRYTLLTINFAIFYVKSFVKSKLTGKIVFRAELSQKHQVYTTFFKHIIADENVKEDVKEDFKFKWLKIENDNTEQNFMERWRYQERAYDRPSQLSLNYFNEDEKLRYKQEYGMSEQITKIFKFVSDKNTFGEHDIRDSLTEKYFRTPRTFYIRFTWKKI